ncbi:hypothetical protein EIN_060240, partial [Entamoeba invadens IP1]|uniref:hypothetical protein n=1 Tax=Entamoeba invadens IP1 TaxID=370355 RepID=UPI0002C3E69D
MNNEIDRYIDRDDVEIAYQRKSFITEDIYMMWLERCIKPELELRRKNCPQEWAVLIQDNCVSHIKDGARKWLFENKVALLLLCPHSSHLSQPLNVVIFGVQKRAMGSSVFSRLVGMKYPVGVMSQKDDVEDEVKKATKRRKMEILELKDQDGAIDAAKLEELSVCMVTKRVVEIIQSFKIACVNNNNNTSAFHMCGYVKKPIGKEKDGNYDVGIFNGR